MNALVTFREADKVHLWVFQLCCGIRRVLSTGWCTYDIVNEILIKGDRLYLDALQNGRIQDAETISPTRWGSWQLMASSNKSIIVESTTCTNELPVWQTQIISDYGVAALHFLLETSSTRNTWKPHDLFSSRLTRLPQFLCSSQRDIKQNESYWLKCTLLSADFARHGFGESLCKCHRNLVPTCQIKWKYVIYRIYHIP